MARWTGPLEPGPLDWTHARVGNPSPCIHCGTPALLRHPVTGVPCHRVCEDQQWPGDGMLHGGVRGR